MCHCIEEFHAMASIFSINWHIPAYIVDVRALTYSHTCTRIHSIRHYWKSYYTHTYWHMHRNSSLWLLLSLAHTQAERLKYTLQKHIPTQVCTYSLILSVIIIIYKKKFSKWLPSNFSIPIRWKCEIFFVDRKQHTEENKFKIEKQ